ncbi:MAG: biotin--[acetyl-CoA-carboxylase] ligase [Thermoproteota archaeon]|nr:biotin--[acetyl-CoA-carboxylase] ligase [Thermoproteota archaeon]
MIKIVCSDKQKLDFIYNILNKSKRNLFFQEFYFYDYLSSTQDYAFLLGKKSETCYPYLVLSEIQTGGRGRRGSNWASPRGGVWMTIVFKTDLEPSELFCMLILTTLVISDAIKSQLHITPQIKWPNDLLINGSKVAGILMDTEIEYGKMTKVTLGIGINSNNDLVVTKSQIIDKSVAGDLKITTLKYANDGLEINNFELVSFILYKFSELVPKLESKLYRDELRNLYRRRIEESLSTLSYKFRIKEYEFKGEIIKVNDDGSLLVRDLEQLTDNKIVRIDSVFNSSLT